MIYSNGSSDLLYFPETVPLTQPLIRALPHTPGHGRTYATYSAQGAAAFAHVTPRGHWYRDGDAVCRGCGARLVGPSMAATDSVLDIWRCTHPGSQQDVAIALLGRQAVAAR